MREPLLYTEIEREWTSYGPLLGQLEHEYKYLSPTTIYDTPP